uniref:Sodium-coupled neutral amino acid transporter 7 n=1 Tax=Amazona collaria TaxID=241587 RepID=A0A8B9GGG1_9PSIT
MTATAEPMTLVCWSWTRTTKECHCFNTCLFFLPKPLAARSAAPCTAGLHQHLLWGQWVMVPGIIPWEGRAGSLSVIGTWYVTAVIIIKYIWPNKKLVPMMVTVAIICHMSSVPVFNSMKQPEVKIWVVVVMVAMVITLFVYTGVCGFLTFGVGVEQDVLMSYPSNDIPVALAPALIVLCVLTSYPILHFCGRVTVEKDMVWDWFLLILLLALFISDTGKVISVIGGLAACFIFIFPGLCLIQAKLSEIQETRTVSWWAQVSYGVFMVTLGHTIANAIFVDLTA